MEHYFTNNENLRSNLNIINYDIFNTSFAFYTDNGVFSKKKIDYGTELLLKSFINEHSEPLKILDVGCGYGVITVVVSKMTGSHVDALDINKRSVHLTKMNIEKNKVDANALVSNVYEQVTEKYDVIISNPPIRAGNKVVYDILSNSKKHMNQNGELWFVIRKDQGALTIAKNISEEFEVELVNRDKGYNIYKAKIKAKDTLTKY